MTSSIPAPQCLRKITRCVIAAMVLAGCGRQEQAVPPSPATNATSARPAEMKPQFRPLLGKWLRTDSDYTIEITGIDSEGKMTAAYFNPRPINVSRAVAFLAEGKVRVAIELRDAGYPGCIYDLTLDPGNERLAGTYFQAAMEETYKIDFTKVRP